MLYTGRGDDGYTDLLGGPRIAKESLRIAALGDADEASAAVGLARAHARDDSKAALLHVQKDLYLLMADIATVEGKMAGQQRLDDERVAQLERLVAGFEERIELPKEFVAPGETVPGAVLDVARTVVRRAERTVAALFHEGEGATQAMVTYLNRLSSLLWVLARYEDMQAGAQTIVAKEIEEHI